MDVEVPNEAHAPADANKYGHEAVCPSASFTSRRCLPCSAACLRAAASNSASLTGLAAAPPAASAAAAWPAAAGCAKGHERCYWQSKRSKTACHRTADCNKAVTHSNCSRGISPGMSPRAAAFVALQRAGVPPRFVPAARLPARRTLWPSLLLLPLAGPLRLPPSRHLQHASSRRLQHASPASRLSQLVQCRRPSGRRAFAAGRPSPSPPGLLSAASESGRRLRGRRCTDLHWLRRLRSRHHLDSCLLHCGRRRRCHPPCQQPPLLGPLLHQALLHRKRLRCRRCCPGDCACWGCCRLRRRRLWRCGCGRCQAARHPAAPRQRGTHPALQTPSVFRAVHQLRRWHRCQNAA